jgi:hypothetical protein
MALTGAAQSIMLRAGSKHGGPAQQIDASMQDIDEREGMA